MKNLTKLKPLKRTVLLTGTDIEMVLSKVTAVTTKQNMIHFDELNDGTWRLIYNGDHIPDFTKIKEFKILREGELPDPDPSIAQREMAFRGLTQSIAMERLVHVCDRLLVAHEMSEVDWDAMNDLKVLLAGRNED